MVIKELVEIFGSGGNYAAVRMPGRKSYGVVFQADSLAGLVSDLNGALRILREGDAMEAQKELKLVCDRLSKIANLAEKEVNSAINTGDARDVG